MSKKILAFNAAYYFVTLAFFVAGKKDPSSSLGYGFFIVIFWLIAAVTLVVLILKRTIMPKTILDKIGIFTATPALCVLAVTLIVGIDDEDSSEGYTYRDNYEWKDLRFSYGETGGLKRVEYYRSADTTSPGSLDYNIQWVKDSTWVYFSKAGDTYKKITYKNGIKISDFVK